MPGRMKRILPIMAAGNWLASYAEVDNISLALHGMSHRTKFDSGIENGAKDLIIHYHDLEKDFEDFFPDMIDFARKFIENPDI